MNLKEQLYVCTLARCRTIAKAAEELYISQPALSVYISNLEKYLGVSLFERTGKSFLLTYAGEEYVKRASKMLEMKDEFDDIVRAIHTNTKGRVRLGLQTRRAANYTPYILSEFSSIYPDVDLIILDGVQDVLTRFYYENQVDLMFGSKIETLADAQFVPVTDEYLILAVPKDHPANAFAYQKDDSPYPHIDLSHFDNETFVLPQKDQNLRPTIMNLFDQEHIRPKKIYEIRSFEAMITMAAEGIGISFSRSGYARFMKHPNVNYYLIGKHPIKSPLVFTYRKGKIIDPYMQAVMDIITDLATEPIH